ncbi:helix-turn-helix domain-containing protein [uncultured Shewanella sp.]|uniref:winged helix-turn-helix transcriptional regulator n=1 Tax=uncultured Shewanella sp. TaxID=173975 RepID=UPI002610E3E5|nr:helix-turn-helix domain-containing protein [uncultured Shewanella sp.]
MKHTDYDCNLGCPVEATLNTIGGKWKGVILYHLLTKTHRFNELDRLMPSITQRMLTKQLRELEADNVILRKVYPEIPPKVEYSMTPYGQTLAPIINALHAWGIQHLESTPRK